MANKKTLAERVVYLLERSFQQTIRSANEETFGIDHVTLKAFASQWSVHKKLIRDQVLDGSYRFSPLLGVAIAKQRNLPVSLSNARPISIPTVRDRVVQRAMLLAMWPQIRDHIWTDSSYGAIRPYHLKVSRNPENAGHNVPKPVIEKRSVRKAIERVLHLRDDGRSWVFETDIEKFFPSIDKNLLLDRLYELLAPDASLSCLLESAVVTEIGNADRLGELSKLWNPERGLPQGGVLSPLLANFYLYSFDHAIEAAGFKMVRYVDDLVVMCGTEDEARRAYELCQAELVRLGLDIHPLSTPGQPLTKTRLVGPGQTLEFLGVAISKHSLRPRQKKWDGLWERIVEVTDARSMNNHNLVEVVRSVNAVVRGWVNSFRFCNFSESELTEIDRKVHARVAGWMKLNGLTNDPNLLDSRRARALGLLSSHGVKLEPILGRSRSGAGANPA